MAGEKNYHRVLEDHKKRLGDYEQVHFRKSFISERGRAQSILSLAPPASGSGSGTGITLAPRRSSKPLPQLVPFTTSSAALYLRQTENLWLRPNQTRTSAAKALFDRPTGTFIVRNSQKARYALSVRVPTDDPAVSHFLIQTNQQGFLTIQGSNLPFLSIYDLLAYFCFNKSGGMPCLLNKPEPESEKQSMDSSDSSDSEEETKEPYRHRAYLTQHYGSVSPPPSSSLPTSPPPVPPHHVTAPSRRGPTPSLSSQRSRDKTPSVGSDSYPVHEEIFIDSLKQSDYIRGMKERRREKSRSRSPHSHSPSPPPPLPTPHHRKRQPPPKPPRGSTLEDVLENHNEVPSEEAQLVVRSVDGIVDMDAKKLYHNFQKIQLENGQAEGQRGGQAAELASVSPRSSLQRKISLSSNDVREINRVNSLVEMFEHVLKKGPPSPSPSPPITALSSSPSPSSFRQRLPHQSSAPSVPPRPARPARPPRPTSRTSSHDEAPAIPPHTPVPLLPPKPLSSRAPYLFPRERSSSDTTRSKPRPPAPPPGNSSPPILPPKTYVPQRSEEPHYEFDKELKAKLAAHKAKEALAAGEGVGEGWVNVSSELIESSLNGLVNSTSEQITESERDLQELTTSVTGEGGGKEKGKRKRAWPKKLPKFYRKPRKKIKKLILDLAGDTNQEFGKRTTEFVSDMKSRSTDQPYQRMLAEIRNFISAMHDHLLQHHHAELVNSGMDSCNNFEHVVETALQHCILQPLSHHVYLRIDEHFMENGALFQVQRSVHQGKNKSPEEMGIREGLVVPSDKAISEIGAVFNRMIKTYCAISKLEYLLEAVRLTYENVRDSKNPKKSMSDLGADDFLPLFVWVLVQCSFTRAEIEAEYMWGLAHPSLFNGEAGYYLTTLTSAVNVLKETQHSPAIPPSVDLEEQIQQLPCMNNLQTELKVYFEDASTGQYSSAYRLPIVPTMTAAEVCEIIGERHCKSNPQKYGLYMVVDGQATEMGKEELPQEVKLKWALDTSNSKSPAFQRQPSKRFIAYRLRAPEHT